MIVCHKGRSMADAMTNPMAQSNSMANSNSMADTDSMANAMTNSMTKSMANSVICHFRHITSDVVGMVVDMLGPSVREQHSVGSLPSSSAIVRLVLAEVGPGQLISHAVVVGVGNNLTKASVTT